MVTDFSDIGGEQGGQQGVPVAGIAVLVQLGCGGGVRSGSPLDGEDREVRQGVDGHMVRLTPLGQQGLSLLLRLQRLHGDGILRGGLGVPMGGEAVPVDELLKLQLQQQVIELRGKGAAEVVLRGEVQRGIGDNGGQIPGVLGALLALL